MAIPENQLETWSHQGSVTQSSSTYATIRRTLEEKGTAYYDKSFEVFLQGSYGNDTNIYSESDVDVIIRLDSTYYYDLENLPQNQIDAFNSAFSKATYTWSQFKNDVLSHLSLKYPTQVISGSKSIKISSSGNRRSTDVIAAAQYRRYHKFNSIYDQSYDEGICFFNSAGSIIPNYPKQHSNNCTIKHQTTNSWFKPMVRIMKNMRTKLVDDGIIAKDIAPSYFIEGLLYNVPSDQFGKSYVNSFINSLNWIKAGDNSKFVCANEQYYLLRDNSMLCWEPSKFDVFIRALTNLWDNW